MGASPLRNFSMVLRKRPKCVAVNKYKLKTKKAAQYRISIVSDSSNYTDWWVERPWIQIQLAGPSPLEQKQVMEQPTPCSAQTHPNSHGRRKENEADATLLPPPQVLESLKLVNYNLITKVRPHVLQICPRTCVPKL